MPAETVPIARLRTLIRRWAQLRGNARHEREAATHDWEQGFLWGYVYGLGEVTADVRAIIEEAKKGEIQ